MLLKLGLLEDSILLGQNGTGQVGDANDKEKLFKVTIYC